MSQIVVYGPAGGGPIGSVVTLTGNSGVPVTPDGVGNINVIGAGPLTFAGASHTLTGSISTATTAAVGVIQIATNAEAIAGTDTAKAITADDLKAKLGTQTAHSLLVAEGTSSALTALGVATNGQIPIGSSAADPVLATLTAGPGIGITNGAGSITITATGAGFTWTDVTGASQALAVENGYFADRATLITFTLPATAALGDTIKIVGKGAGLYTIAQNAGQSIHFVGSTTTVGVGGTLTSLEQYDAITLICSVANNEFTVDSSTGNFTIV